MRGNFRNIVGREGQSIPVIEQRAIDVAEQGHARQRCSQRPWAHGPNLSAVRAQGHPVTNNWLLDIGYWLLVSLLLLLLLLLPG